jgi:hypothetical protein
MHSDRLLPPKQPIVKSLEIVHLMYCAINSRVCTVEEVGRQTVHPVAIVYV